MDQFNDIFYLLAFFIVAGVTATLFYIWGQFADRGGNNKKQKLLVNSLSSHKRLTNELRHETNVHRRIADEYRGAYEKKEEYWMSVKKRWQDEAEKAKQIIAQQEELRTKHAISLKEANRKLMSIENEYQKNKRDNLAQINVLKSNQEEPEKIKLFEKKAAEVDKKYTTEIELKRTKINELQLNLKKRDEKLSKLENIILKKNSDINDLKTRIKQNGELESKLTAVNASLTEKEKRYEAVKLDLKTRNDSLTELQKNLEESKLKCDELEELAAKGTELEDIKKTMFIKETQLVEKESAMKKLAGELDQKQHQVGLLQTDLNARNQKLTALVSQMEDTSELDTAMEKIGMLTNDVQGRDEKISTLKEQLKGVELVFEKQKEHVANLKEQGVLKDSTIEKLNNDLSEKNGKLSNLQVQIKDLEKALVKKDSDINSLNKQLKDTTQMDQLSAKIKEFELQLNTRGEEINKLVDESKDKNAKIAELEKKCNDLNSKLADTSERDNLNGRLSLLQSQLSEKDTVLSKAQKTLSEEQSKVAKLAEDTKKPLAELTDLKKVLLSKEKELEKLDQKNVSYESKIELLETTVSEKDTEIKGQKEALSNMELQLQDNSEQEKFTKQIDALKATNDHQQSLIAEHNSVLGAKKEEFLKQRNQFAEKENHITHLQQELQSIRAQKTKDLNELNTLRKHVKDTSERDELADQLEKTKAELGSKQKQLDESHEANVGRQKRIEELERYLGERDATTVKLSDKIKGLEDKVEQDTAQINNLNDQLEDQSEVEGVRQKLGLFQTDISQKESIISDLGNNLKARETKISELEHLLGERDNKIVSFGGMQDELDEKKRTYSLLHNDYQSNIDKLKDLEKHNTGKQQRIDQLESYLRDTHAELKDLKSKLQDTSQLEGLTAELERKNTELEALNSHAETANKELQIKVKQLDESHAEVKRLRSELENTSEIDSLHLVIKEKEAKLSELHSKINSQGAELNKSKGFAAELGHIKKELGIKVEQLDASHAEVERLRKELENTSEIDGLKSTLKEKEAAMNKLQSELETQGAKLAKSNGVASKLGQLQKDLDTKAKQLNESHAEVKRLRNELENTSEIDGLKSNLKEREAAMNKLQSELETQGAKLAKSNVVASKLELLQKDVDTKAKQLNESHAEVKRLRKELENTSEIDGLKSTLKEKEAAMNKLQSELETQGAKLAKSNGVASDLMQLQKDLESKAKQLDESHAEVGRLRSELENTSELDALKSTLIEKEDHVKALQSEIDSKGSEIKTLYSKVVDPNEIAKLKSDLADSHQALESLTDQKFQLNEKSEIAERQLVESHLEVERLRKELTDTSKLDVLNKQITSKQERIDLLLVENKGKHERLIELEKTTIHQSDELIKLQQTLGNSTEIDHLKDEIDQKDITLNSIRQEAEVAQTRAQELENQRNTHLAEITELRAEVNSSRQKLADTSRVDDLKNQLDHKIGFINTLSNQTSEKESKITDLEKALAKSEHEIESLKSLSNDTSEIDKIREALNYKTLELNKLTHLMETKDAILNELEAALNHAKSELLTIKSSINDTSEVDGLKDQLAGKNKQLDDIHKENVNHQDEISTLKSRIQQKQNELERAIAKASDTSELTLLKEKLEEREGRVKFLSEKTSTTASRLEELEKHVESRDAEISKLQDKLSDTSKLDKAITELEKKEALVNKLSSETSNQQKTVTKLEESLSEIENKYSGKDEEIERLRKQITELTKQTMLASFGAGVEQDADKGIIYLKAPKSQDNLGDIFGVSDSLHSQLNKLGIYKHKQIALWSERQIDYFQKELEFDGNIQREQWAIQAQRLAE